MRLSFAASTALHAGVIVLGLVSFAGTRPFDPQPESMPVDIVSAAEFTKMTKGATTAKKQETPKQVAEKVDVPKPADDPNLKVSEKPPVEATTPPPPAPTPPPQPKAETQPPAPPKTEQAAPQAQPKADEALKQEQKKEEAKKEEAKPAPQPLPPKKPAPPKETPKTVDNQSQERRFDADQIKQLLDKRTPQRQAAAADAVSQTASLGSPRGEAQTLSQSEIDAFRARLRQCWNPPPSSPSQEKQMSVNLVVSFKPDGTLAGEPVVSEVRGASFGPALRDSAMRAILRCQPYTMLRPETYKVWKVMDLTFRPDMFD